ncbi:hypothetical protein LSCM1_00817 [Leishmania martiniquensis]|uniref:RRM domain-containing protein n=1 Tax=Leishmania martiniquensis TaxID=1580590 RepID=A0A836GYL1_9TRYP|nr:hypothetical protein LSCM1_00817 [Leishmania martiniquensis]
MWKQSVGDWQERRQRRRGGPISDSPHAHLPDSIDATENIRRGFLPREFCDRVPKSAYPAADGPETRLHPSKYTPVEQETLGSLLASTWVVVSGVPADDILDVRDYFDAYVGRTVAHYVSIATSTRSEVYIQFASSLEAAQAVRTSAYSFNVENGTAAEGLRSFGSASGMPKSPPRSLELAVGWCRDQVFLEGRESLRRQILQVGPHSQRGAALAPVSSVAKAPYTNEVQSPLSSVSPSLESSARGSDAAAATGGDEDDGAAHPLLPRHRSRSSRVQPASRYSTAEDTVPSRFSASVSAQEGGDAVLGNVKASARTPMVDSDYYCQQNGAYRPEDNFLSESLHRSFSAAGRRHATLLNLFFHPCSSSPEAQWTRLCYYPLRVVVLLLWTAWNLLASLLPLPWTSLFKDRHGSRFQPEVSPGGAVSSVATRSPSPPTVMPQPSQWRRRRSLRVADVVPASASPFEYISFLLYKYVPFAPEPQAVDMALWSWLILRNPYPQQSLRRLKQRLLVRQRSASAVTGRLQGDGGPDVAAADVAQWTSFEKKPIGWEPQQTVKLRQELPVLLAWRPAWWFTRYSSLSLFMLVVLVYWYV